MLEFRVSEGFSFRREKVLWCSASGFNLRFAVAEGLVSV